MTYEVKGRIIQNRPLRYRPPKKEPRERVVYTGPLCPRLRPKEGLTHAVGFTARIVSNDE